MHLRFVWAAVVHAAGRCCRMSDVLDRAAALVMHFTDLAMYVPATSTVCKQSSITMGCLVWYCLPEAAGA